jgi:hypothetical protein
MNQPSEDIAAILASNIGTLTLGTNLFTSQMPQAAADKSVCVIDTGGYDPVALLDKDTVQRPTVQIIVRGDKGKNQTAYALAKTIDDVLDLMDRATEGGTVYIGIYKVGDITSLGQDDDNRPLWSMNFRIDRTS